MPSLPSARRSRPSKATGHERLDFLTAQPFAHRGLHGDGIVENSRGAFISAMAAGHGIELDIQLSSDGVPMVFHDDTLDRLTHSTGRIDARDAGELGRIRLRGQSETIPTLAQILDLVGGRVPVLIEMKSEGAKVAALCLSVRRELEGYRGAVGVMSFNALVVGWFRDRSPRTVRGLVVSQQGEQTLLARLNGAVRRWRAVNHADPEFIACDVRNLPSRFAARARSKGLPVLSWTVRSSADHSTALAYADQPIYERADD